MLKLSHRNELLPHSNKILPIPIGFYLHQRSARVFYISLLCQMKWKFVKRSINTTNAPHIRKKIDRKKPLCIDWSECC